MGQAALTQGSSTGLWLSGHQQGLRLQPHLPSLSYPVGNFQEIFGKKCGLEPVETKQPRGSLASEHSPSPAGVSHPGQAHTVPFPQPSHPRAHPTLPNHHQIPFFGRTGMSENHSSSPGLAKKPHVRGKSLPDSNDSHFLKGKFPSSAHSVLTRTAGDPPHEY